MINHHPHTENGVLPFLKVSENLIKPLKRGVVKEFRQVENNFPQPSYRLLSISEAAKKLNLRRSEVSKLIWNGKIKIIEIGKRVKIPESAVAEWINATSKYLVMKRPYAAAENLCVKESPKDIIKRLRRK